MKKNLTDKKNQVVFKITLAFLVFLAMFFIAAGYLAAAKYGYISIPSYFLKFHHIDQILMDENLKKINEFWEKETGSNPQDFFNTTWDANSEVTMSKKEFRTVDMEGEPKYMYQPGLKKITFQLLSNRGPRNMEMIESPQLKALLVPMPITHIKEATFNGEGFRETGYPWAPNCAQTALFVGDSFTEGLWVSNQETFASRFGEIAQSQLKEKVCVINSGENGYSAIEESYIVENYYEKFHFQTVFLMHFPNDIYFQWPQVLDQSAPDLEKRWEWNFRYMKRISDFCKKNNIRLVVTAIPPQEQFDSPETRKNYQEKLREFSEKEGVRFIDLFQEFSPKNPRENYFDWDAHFNPEGHDAVAKILWDKTEDFFIKK